MWWPQCASYNANSTSNYPSCELWPIWSIMFCLYKGGRTQQMHGPNFHSRRQGDDTPPFATPCRPPDDVAKPCGGVLVSNFRTDWYPTSDDDWRTPISHLLRPAPTPSLIRPVARISDGSRGCTRLLWRPRGSTRPQPRVSPVRHEHRSGRVSWRRELYRWINRCWLCATESCRSLFPNLTSSYPTVT